MGLFKNIRLATDLKMSLGRALAAPTDLEFKVAIARTAVVAEGVLDGWNNTRSMSGSAKDQLFDIAATIKAGKSYLDQHPGTESIVRQSMFEPYQRLDSIYG